MLKWSGDVIVALILAFGLALGLAHAQGQSGDAGPPEDRGKPDNPGERSPAGEAGAANAGQGLGGIDMAREHVPEAGQTGLDTAVDAILDAIEGN